MLDDANHRLIQERAYQIWLREGCPHGRDRDHWQQAEQEVAKQYHASDARADKPRPSQATAPAAHGADSQPRPDNRSETHVDSPSGATPAAADGTEDAPKKRASRTKLKEDPGAAAKGKPSKKQAGDSAIREPPRK
jgi:hypothetical protein